MMAPRRTGFAWLALLVSVLTFACGRISGNAPSPQGPVETAGTWEAIESAELGWYRPVAFWVDGELIVAAGPSLMAWRSEPDGWEVLVTIPQASESEGSGDGASAVWTGSEILIWGGGFSYRADGAISTGAGFDPRTSELRALPDSPIPVRWWHTAVWTGREMIVWGGADGDHERVDGAAYDPAADSWRRIADGPMGGYAHTAVWTGREMIVWGGSDDYEAEGSRGYPRSFLSTGAAYDPASDSWRTLEPAPLEPRGWHAAVWTGAELLIWGGVADCTQPTCTYPDDAGAYDPEAHTWREISAGPLPGRVDHTAVWTGSRMLVWGGSPPGGGLGYQDGGSYDPQGDRWHELPSSPIAGRFRHAAIWADDVMIVWGGQGANGPFDDGALYRP
jgi:hypothetical protein